MHCHFKSDRHPRNHAKWLLLRNVDWEENARELSKVKEMVSILFLCGSSSCIFCCMQIKPWCFVFFFFFFTKLTSSCFEGSSLDRSYLCQERCIPELKEVRVVTPVSHSDKQWQPWLVPAACVCPDGSSERFYIFKCSEKIARIIFDDAQK